MSRNLLWPTKGCGSFGASKKHPSRRGDTPAASGEAEGKGEKEGLGDWEGDVGDCDSAGVAFAWSVDPIQEIFPFITKHIQKNIMHL